LALAIVDSDVLIDVLRNAPGAAERLASLSLAYDLATTTVTVFEIVRAVQSEQEEQRFFELVGEFDILSFGLEAAQSASQAWRATRAAGTPVETGDLLIAGIAIAHGAMVITRNERDFRRIPELEVLTL
jgi:predicted nucleic acid-binding protein